MAVLYYTNFTNREFVFCARHVMLLYWGGCWEGHMTRVCPAAMKDAMITGQTLKWCNTINTKNIYIFFGRFNKFPDFKNSFSGNYFIVQDLQRQSFNDINPVPIKMPPFWRWMQLFNFLCAQSVFFFFFFVRKATYEMLAHSCQTNSESISMW